MQPRSDRCLLRVSAVRGGSRQLTQRDATSGYEVDGGRRDAERGPVCPLKATKPGGCTCDVVTCEALSFGGGHSSELRHIESLLDALEFVALTPTAARWAGASRRARHRAGGKLSVGDALIAGLAAELEAAVVTRNVRDFAQQGIQTLDY